MNDFHIPEQASKADAGSTSAMSTIEASLKAGQDSGGFIADVWYVAATKGELKRSGHLELMVCGQMLRLSLAANGAAVAVNLSDGGAQLPCALSEDMVWVFWAAKDSAGSPRPPVPAFDAPGARVRFVENVVIPAHQDDAAYGLLDPAHTPFVHKSPLWRGNGVHKLKTKRFEPEGVGFTMMPHAPVNSDIYKLIGGAITVRIAFTLPGLRAEYISNDRHTVLGLTALTPIDERHTRLRQIMFWNSPVMDMLRPLVPLWAGPFLAQDVRIMRLRRENEDVAGKGMLLGESDRQFLWYLQLKKEWRAARAEGRPFLNPLEPATLQWRT